ncbi:MAG: Ig-like domain-containing protein [Verrucomicrobiota bacterium]
MDISLDNYFSGATSYAASVTNASPIVSVSLVSGGRTLRLNFDNFNTGTNNVIVVATDGIINITNVFAVWEMKAATGNMGNLTVNEDSPTTNFNLSTIYTYAVGYKVLANNHPEIVNASISGSTLTLSFPTNANGIAQISLFATNAADPNIDVFNVTVNPVPDYPTIIVPGVMPLTVNDNATIPPFANVVITNVDGANQTMDVFVQLTNASKGSFGGPAVGAGGFNIVGDGTSGKYALLGATATNITALIQQLIFTPSANQVPVGDSETQLVTIIVTNNSSGLASWNSNTLIKVVSVNDPPSISGTSSNSQLVFSGQSIKPFSSVIVSDPDVSDTAGYGQALNLVITVSGDTGGKLTYSGSSGFTQSGSVYSLSTRPASVITAAIQAMVWQATAATLANPVSNSFQIQVTDSLGASVSDNSTTIQTVTPFVSPDITGSISDQPAPDNQALLCFSQIKIQGSGTKVQIRLLRESDLASSGDQFGQLVNLGSNGFVKVNTGSSAYYQLDNTTMDQATPLLKNVAFRPNENQVSGPTRVIMEIKLFNSGGSVLGSDSKTSVIIQPVNDLPIILGAKAGTYITDHQVATPFLTRTNPQPNLVRIIDVDQAGTQPVTVTIQLDDALKGGFTNSLAAGFHLVAGQYVLTNVTPDVASSNLEMLVFKPTPNRLAPGYTETVKFTLYVDDGQGQGTVKNDVTTVIVNAVNDPPVITLMPSNVLTAIGSSVINPFAACTIADPNIGDVLNVNITLDDPAKGTFSALGGFTNSPAYTFIGSAAQANTDFKNLIYNPNLAYSPPPGQSAKVVTFTITVYDSLNATFTTNLTLNVINTNRTWIVTTTNDSGPGTLRQAVSSAGNGDQIVFNMTNLPAIIRLNTEIVLNKALRINGPGADKVTISGDSNGDGVPDVRIFHITNSAIVSIAGLTMSYGSADYLGGAISVEYLSQLRLSYCTLANNISGQWGGAVDVSGGSIYAANCLFASNTVTAALGLGGGAVSLYTDMDCHFENVTFSGNTLAAARGFGGGAIYVENADVGTPMDTTVTSCTFVNNRDASGLASSLRAIAFDTTVDVKNTIVADGHGTNLAVDAGAEIRTLGGNISDDSTRIVFSQSGDPVNVVIFTNASDLVSVTNVGLLPLTNNGGGTMTHALSASSPAIGHAVTNSLATDQRGYLRSASVDSGAYEYGIPSHIRINEIMFNASAGLANQFIEFINSKASTTTSLTGFTVWVDGILVHTFTSVSLPPSAGIVLAASASVSVPAPVARQNANGPTGLLNLSANSSTITLKNASGQEIISVTYNGLFNSASSPLVDESINLSPEFLGFSYVPYTQVPSRLDGLTSSPGADNQGKLLVKANTPPIAINDFAATDQNTATNLAVLANDIELDLEDTIHILWASNSTLGATVTVSLDRQIVTYNPTTSVILRGLPVGAVTNDTFKYCIIDCCDPATGTNWAMTGLNYTGMVTVAVTGLNDAPTPQTDTNLTGLATLANLILNINVQTNLLNNDTDPDTDDNANTLLIAAVHSTSNYVSSLVATSTLGAVVTLDVRADRNQTRILYDGRFSSNLIALAQGEVAIDQFWYSVVDRHGALGQAAVYITVTGVNDPPIAMPDFLSTDENTTIINPASRFLVNDYDPDHGASTNFSIVGVSSSSTMGALVTLTGANVIYNPSASTNLLKLSRKEFAVDTFTYVMTDGFGSYSTGLVSVTVAGVNNLPVAMPDHYNYTNSGQILTVSAANGVLVNDYDPDVNGIPPDDVIRVIAFTNHQTAARAVVNMDIYGAFTFDPSNRFDWLPPGQTTDEIFTYTLADNSMTIATDDDFMIQSGSVSNNLPVLANDGLLTASGGTLTISAVGTSDKGGIVNIAADKKSLIYAPAQGFVGLETVTYTISDGQDRSDTATVHLHVLSTTVNGILTANPDKFSVAAGATASLNVLANDYVLGTSGANLGITGVSTGSAGGVIVIAGAVPNNTLTYTPQPGAGASFPYYETFNYVVSGTDLGSATGAVTITVVSLSNSLPVTADTYDVAANTGNNPLDVLANDKLISGVNPTLTIASIQATGLVGTVSLDTGNNRLRYTPALGSNDYVETDFYYTAVDGSGATGTGTVSIKVKNAGLFAVDNAYTVLKNSTNLYLPVLANDTALPASGQVLTISAMGLGTNAPNQGGTATINGGSSAILYTPFNNFAGNETFTYEISDGSLSRAEGRVRIKVVDVGAIPSNPDYYSVALNSSGNSLPVLVNDYVLPRGSSTLTVVALNTNGLLGTVSLSSSSADNTVIYTPPSGFIGRDVFSYTCQNERGDRSTNTVYLVVGSLYTTTDSFSVVSDTTSNVLDVLANDAFFPNTNVVRKIVGVGATDQGGWVSNAVNAVVYSPASGFAGLEKFTYRVLADNGGMYTQSVAITVIKVRSDRTNGLVTIAVWGVNHPPVARPDFFATDEDTPLVIPSISVMANDSDPDTGIHFVSAATNSAMGALISTNNGKILYDPRGAVALQALANREVAQDTFTYTIADDQGATASTVVTITVSGRNDPPIPGTNSYATTEKTILNIVAPGILSSAHDPDVNGIAPDDTLHLIPATNQTTTAGAKVTLRANGSFTYDPSGKFNYLAVGQTATDSFAYTLVDSSLTMASDDLFTVVTNTTNNLLPVLANDAVFANTGGSMSVLSVGSPSAGGLVTITPAKDALYYTPAAGFTGTESFTYTITDGQQGVNTATVRVSVLAAPASPMCNADSFVVMGNTTANILNVLTNDFILPGTVSVRPISSVGSGNRGGILALNSDATAILYSPAFGFAGVETFNYQVIGLTGLVQSVTATINVIPVIPDRTNGITTITVTGVNDPPTPAADYLNAYAAVALQVNVQTNLLANDTDPDSDDNANTLLISSLQATTNSTPGLQIFTTLGAKVVLDIRFDRNQSQLTYDPITSATIQGLSYGQSVTDCFYYTVLDGHGASGSAPVYVTVSAVNVPPQANRDTVTTDEDTPLTIPTAVLLSNDTDVNRADVLQIISVSTNSVYGASVTLSGTNVIYNPTVSTALNALARKETASDSFTYILSDGAGGTSTGMVTVVVLGRNDAPVAMPDFFATLDTAMLSVAAPGVLTNDYDPDVNGILPDDQIRMFFATNTHSTLGAPVTVNLDGSFTYDPRGVFTNMVVDQTTNDTFTYVITDSSLTIANDDVFSAKRGSSNNVLPVLANDALLSGIGGSLSLSTVGVPNQGGNVTINTQSQVLVYTPAVNFTGTETFTYTITDARGGTDTATVAIRVFGDVDNPVLAANADRFTVAAGTATDLDVLANDNILPKSGSALTITSTSQPNLNGTLSIVGASPGNHLAYSPNPGITASFPYFETFTYTATGANGLLATGAVTIQVINRTNTLVVNPDSFVVSSTSSNVPLDVLANDIVLPAISTNLSITMLQTNGVMGRVAIEASGKRLLYTPSALTNNYSEPVFSYTISDGAGGSAVGAVSVRVKPTGLYAVQDTYTVIKNSTNVILPPLVNDLVLPASGQTLMILNIGLGTNAPSQGGTVSINASSNLLTYSPVANYVGDETFTYEITDGTLARAQAQIVIHVVDTATLNSNPDAFTIARDAGAQTLDVLRNDRVLPTSLAVLTIAGITTNGVRGALALTGAGANNAITYTPPAGFIGREVFSYAVTDQYGNRSTNSVTLQVGELVGRNDQFAVLENSTNSVLDVLANDLILSDPASVRNLAGVGAGNRGGLVSTNLAGNRVIYTPAPGYTGVENFTYYLADDSGRWLTQMVAVAVMPIGSDRSTGAVNIIVSRTGPKSIWRQQIFAPTILANPSLQATVWGDNADPDHDGLSNRQEYLLGSNPTNTVSVGQLVVANTLSADSQHVSFSFPRRRNDPTIICTLLISQDLRIWQSGQSLIDRETVIAINADFESVTWLIRKDPNHKLFYRLGMQ